MFGIIASVHCMCGWYVGQRYTGSICGRRDNKTSHSQQGHTLHLVYTAQWNDVDTVRTRNNSYQRIRRRIILKQPIHIFATGPYHFLCDDNDDASVLSFRLFKSRRVVRSVLGAECFAFADAFYQAYVIQSTIRQF